MNLSKINPNDIIRIEMIEKPLTREKGEGLYEWRRGASEKFLVDMIDLEKEVNSVMPGKGIDILDRVQNFYKVYINLATGEVST